MIERLGYKFQPLCWRVLTHYRRQQGYTVEWAIRKLVDLGHDLVDEIKVEYVYQELNLTILRRHDDAHFGLDTYLQKYSGWDSASKKWYTEKTPLSADTALNFKKRYIALALTYIFMSLSATFTLIYLLNTTNT